MSLLPLLMESDRYPLRLTRPEAVLVKGLLIGNSDDVITAFKSVENEISRRQVLRTIAILVTGTIADQVMSGCGRTPTAAVELTQEATAPASATVANTTGPAPSTGEPLIKIDYARSGGRTPPRDRELLEINPDGTFSMWRSVGNATQPPTPIGRFAGQLEPQMQTELQQAAAKAVEAGNFTLTPPPGAATETITLDQVQARLGANDEPEGDWTSLIEQLRYLLGDLTTFPQAAIGLELLDGGRAARLVQQGPDTLRLNLSGLTVRAVLWEGYNKVGDWWASDLPAGATDQINAGPGWSFDLPFDHGFEIAAGQEVVAYVTFAAFDGEQGIPVAMESLRSNLG